VLWDPARGWLE
jgi:hypothetical protein